MKTFKSNFVGVPNPLTSTANQEIIENGVTYTGFSFYNSQDCVVQINKSENIFLFGGQGFLLDNRLESIFSFKIVTDGVDFNYIGYK